MARKKTESGNGPSLTAAAAIAVVQHLDPRHRSLMAELLSRKTTLRVKHAEDGETRHGQSVRIACVNRSDPAFQARFPRAS